MSHISLQQTTANTLQQLIDLLLQIDPQIYSKPLAVLSENTVGKHVRHIIEFYQCLFNGLSLGLVDYDTRTRNLELETNTILAVKALEATIEQIQHISRDQALTLQVEYQPEQPLLVATTLYRELIYNLEHCVHHLATIRIALQSISAHHAIPENFGVAASTLLYRHSACQ